jgi:hypothetical protein
MQQLIGAQPTRPESGPHERFLEIPVPLRVHAEGLRAWIVLDKEEAPWELGPKPCSQYTNRIERSRASATTQYG